ncbi:MAG: DUF1385 domain-containing protein [Deltaproteobacteria bacterium]|nr:MAG: DUF1385 domain-containing protein [Deltaproteobacteria bacterium]
MGNSTATSLGSVTSWQLSAVVGAFKLAFLVAYLLALSSLRDIKRLFMYHGAEHKVVATWQAEQSLTLLHVRQAGLRQERCGTSSLLVLVALTIVLYSVLLPLLLPELGYGLRSDGAAILWKAVLLLPFWGVVYEVHRLLCAWRNLAWVRLLMAPGQALQALTVRPPKDEMLEVAIVALRAVMADDDGAQVTQPQAQAIRSYADVVVRQGH